MNIIRKLYSFSLKKNKTIGAIAGALLLAVLSANMVHASDNRISDKYYGLYTTGEVSAIGRKGVLNHKYADILRDIPETLVAHAGGRVNGLSYTNSKEALDKSYENGYRFIELDFEWTTDGNLALIHDWEGYVNSAFGVESKMYSTEEFKSFQMINGFTQMTLEDLAKWLYEHKDAYIITDIKSNNIEALKLIRYRYPDLVHQIIPQVYKIDEYNPVRGLGYKNIILTLYLSRYSDDQLIDFVKKHEVFAITMPIDRGRTELPKKLRKENVFVYTHTINNEVLRQELESNGVNGFYTDDLLPSSLGVPHIHKVMEQKYFFSV